MTITAKLTSKGQITIPIKLRRKLGLRAGDRVTLHDRGTVVDIEPAANYAAKIERWRGIGVPGIGPGLEAVLAAVREMRGE